MTVPEADLREIVRRIVAAVDPEKIILFGSAARGTMGPHSDIDLLVVKAGEYHHRKVAAALDHALADIQSSVDLVVATPEEVERYKDSFCLVICPAVHEGKAIYEKTPVSAR